MFRRWFIVLLAFCGILYLAAPLVNNNFFYILASVYLLALLLGAGNLFRRADTVKISFDIPERVQAGSSVPVGITICNRSRLPVLTSTGITRFPPELKLTPSAVLIRWLMPQQQVNQPATLDPSQRGIWPVGAVTIEHYGYAGLLYRRAEQAANHELIVHPQPLPRHLAEVLTGTLFDQSGRSYRPAREGEEFYHLRDYRPGDSLRHIHWRTSARQQRLMVAEAEAPSYRQPVIVLDTTGADSRAGDAAFEYNVRLCATLLDFFSRYNGARLEFTGLGDNSFSGGGASADSLRGMLDALAGVKYRGVQAGLQPQIGGREALLIVTTPEGQLASLAAADSVIIINDLWGASHDTPAVGLYYRLSQMGFTRD